MYIYMWYITFITICAIVNIHMAKYKTVGASVALSAQPNGPRFFQRATFGSPWVRTGSCRNFVGWKCFLAVWAAPAAPLHDVMVMVFFKGWMVKHVKRISWICCQYWLVVYPSLWKILVAMIIPNIWEKMFQTTNQITSAAPQKVLFFWRR